MTNKDNPKVVLENPFEVDERWDEDMDFYFRHVSRFMEEGKDFHFTNGRPFHAVYLIYLFLKYARREVRIFSGKLARRADDAFDNGLPVYANEHVLDAAREFLGKRGGRLSIVVADGVDVDQGQDFMQHPMVQMVEDLRERDSLRGRFSIRQLGKDDVMNLDKAGQNHHMLLMDRSAFRWESEPGSSGSRAHVNVNNKGQTELLVNFFDNTLSTMGSLVYPPSTAESNA